MRDWRLSLRGNKMLYMRKLIDGGEAPPFGTTTTQILVWQGVQKIRRQRPLSP